MTLLRQDFGGQAYGAAGAPQPPGGAAAPVPAGERAAASKHGSPTGLTLASIMDELGWFVLDLPRPPSVNRFMKRLGNQSPEVRKWVRTADAIVMARKPYPRLKGPFQLSVWWQIDRFGRFDIDNRLKPLLDWLQRVELIENDKWCRHLTLSWAPVDGCRMAVRSWVAA